MKSTPIFNLRLVVLVIILSIPSFSFANCGQMPDAPALLALDQVNTEQLGNLDDEFDVYLDAIEGFQDCIRASLAGLDPESDGFQTQIEDSMLLIDASEQQKLMASERFNMHVETVSIETDSEESQ